MNRGRLVGFGALGAAACVGACAGLGFLPALVAGGGAALVGARFVGWEVVGGLGVAAAGGAWLFFRRRAQVVRVRVADEGRGERAMTAAPIVCTLTASDMNERLASFAELNGAALRASRQSGLMLELDYDPSATDRVRELVRLEQTCYAFLRFEIEDLSDVVRVRIIAPPEAAAAAEGMFAQFSSRVRVEPHASDEDPA